METEIEILVSGPNEKINTAIKSILSYALAGLNVEIQKSTHNTTLHTSKLIVNNESLNNPINISIK
jgi:hypothetical protein